MHVFAFHRNVNATHEMRMRVCLTFPSCTDQFLDGVDVDGLDATLGHHHVRVLKILGVRDVASNLVPHGRQHDRAVSWRYIQTFVVACGSGTLFLSVNGQNEAWFYSGGNVSFSNRSVSLKTNFCELVFTLFSFALDSDVAPLTDSPPA